MGFLSKLLSAFSNRKSPNAVGMGALEVEYRPPIKSEPCSCCNGTTITLNRMAKRDGYPYAICCLTFSETHLDNPVRGIFGIGQFGEGTEPHQRVAFGVALRPDGVMAIDATEADWPNAEILGPKLSRAEALHHPKKAELFSLIDKLYVEDEALIEHFKMVLSQST